MGGGCSGIWGINTGEQGRAGQSRARAADTTRTDQLPLSKIKKWRRGGDSGDAERVVSVAWGGAWLRGEGQAYGWIGPTRIPGTFPRPRRQVPRWSGQVSTAAWITGHVAGWVIYFFGWTGSWKLSS
ncbi:hypothetical protein ZWY2020_035830 [Hordeum vulgare]|nr:hypothetical protein ZWY2020_035830 [Hordeum vulgare]